jgi:signal transduction histidine kinase/DNA-binding response OmpR family regulator
VAKPFDPFDALPDPAAILAADGTLLRANPAFRATFRHWIGPERTPWGRAQPPPFVSGQRRFEAPFPDGRRFEWGERVLADGVRVAIARDVTKSTLASEELMRAKTALFATLTHELRTPLTGILGMADLLALGALEPNAASYVGAIKQSGELLLDLITEILEYSRLDAGRVELEAAPFSPEAAVQDVAELLSPRAHAKRLELATCIRVGVPARVIGDDGRLRQILFNLAGNAVKFTDAGGVAIEVAPRSGGRLRFLVRDTGPGVPADKQALIFEEFTQAESGIARRHGGAGLGLAIVRKLARAMGGEAGVVSQPGAGATFWVELPLQPSEWSQQTQPLHGLRVALANLAPVTEAALATTIEAMGAAVVEVGDAPDVLLADWREGLEPATVADLKRRARAVIVLAAQEHRAALSDCRAAGLEHYVLKPVRRAALAERIKMALEPPKAAGTPAREATEEALAGLRVLVAEDNPINALLARTLLTRAGCTVRIAQDGGEAVAAANEEAFDLIVLDLRMPRLDGVGAAQRIRAGNGPCAQAPIVALTADAGETERALALEAGMNDFLTKPIDAARLLAVAERFTGRGNLARVAGARREAAR